MTLQFELAGAQIDGARDYQEDAFLITHLNDGDGNPAALVVVADGMGGHAAGNVASNMAVQAFNKNISSAYPCDNIAEVLNDSVVKANHSISETIAETPALNGMGCTMVAAVLEHGRVYWASVGDSHLYLLRDKELTKLNADHSYGGFLDRMAEAGTPVEPEAGLSRNMLMSAITGGEINEIDCPSEGYELIDGDRLLICSDGLDTLSEGKIIQFVEWSETPKECADALLNGVTEADMPKQDNTTVVAVSIVAGAANAKAPVAEEIELSSDELDTSEFEDMTTPAAEETTVPANLPFEVEDESAEKKGSMGMIAIAAVVLLLIGGAGAFFMMGGEQTTQTPPVTQNFELEGDTEQEVEMEMEVADTDEASTESQAATDDQPAKTSTAKTEQSEKPAAVTKSEFRDTLQDGSKGPLMVTIPAGTFAMGNTSSRYREEQPRHEVIAESFAISKYEVTFEEYDRFAKAEGRKLPDSQYSDRKTHPVVFVSWDDAYYYTKWLSEQTGKKYRLPTEAEWEYAANTGKKSPYWWGFEEKPKMAHCFGCGSGFDPRKATAVGSFTANAFGLHDTSGNVAEWIKDCWHDNYKNAPSDAEVWEGGDCSYRVVRGGSFSSPPSSIRSQRRDKFKSDKAYDNIGIRLVRELD